MISVGLCPPSDSSLLAPLERERKKKIDLCYGNVPRAYKSVSLPPVGKSDHNAIHLIPAYRPKIQSDPIVKKSVKVWTPESEEQLRGCFECTEWSMLVDSCDSVSDAANVASSYVTFCEDMLIPSKTVKVLPNNKARISKSIKSTLNEKKIAFQTGDRAEKKRVQAKLMRELREGKREYKAKIEKFQTGNMADAWDGLKTLTGEKKNKSSCSHMTAEEQVKFSNELTDFYCRFERDDLGEDINSVVLELKEKISECEEGKDFEITANVVESLFYETECQESSRSR